jgi:hypothetical protein
VVAVSLPQSFGTARECYIHTNNIERRASYDSYSRR